MSRNINSTGSSVHAGDRRRIWARFLDAADTYTDPDDFTVVIKETDNAPITKMKADFTRDAAGQYYFDHTFTQPGRCKVVVTASDNIIEVEPGYIVVEAV